MDVCISVHIYSQGLSSLSSPESRDWDKDLHKDGLLKHWPRKQEWIRESQWEDMLLRWPCGQLSASRNVCTSHAEGHISPPALAKVALRAPLICISWMHLCVLHPTSGPQRSSRVERKWVWGMVRHLQAAPGEAGLGLCCTPHGGAWSKSSAEKVWPSTQEASSLALVQQMPSKKHNHWCASWLISS